MSFTEQSLVNLFREQAERHLAINSFSAGNSTFLDCMITERQTAFPIIYVQTISATELNRQTTYQFTIYCLDKPSMENEALSDDFEWDNVFAASRDTCKAALNDIICEVKVRNQRNLSIINTGSLISDSDDREGRGTAGWRQTIDLTFDNDEYISANFPSTPDAT